MGYAPKDPHFATRVRASFDRQGLMTLFGATLDRVEPGSVKIAVPFRDDLTQQHGFLHAGVVTAIADVACGYAALTLMPADVAVLSVEYKINLLSPANGLLFKAEGRVVRAGQTLTVCQGDVMSERDDASKRVATMLATMMTIRDRELHD